MVSSTNHSQSNQIEKRGGGGPANKKLEVIEWNTAIRPHPKKYSGSDH